MMKKAFYFLFVSSVLFASCTNSNLSCDEIINRWAEDHLPDLCVNVERSQITEIPLGRQYAIYNGLDSNAKYELWRGKFEMLKKDGNLPDEQKQFFQELFVFISPALFDKDYNPGQRFYELKAKAEALFADSPANYFYSVCTWMTQEEYNSAYLNDSAVITRIDPPGHDEPQKNCTCRHDIECLGQGGTCEKTDKCEQQKACGFLGMYYCNGFCD